MLLVWLRQRLGWLAWAALWISSVAGAQEVADWTQDAVLHDGRVLRVRMHGDSTQQPFYLAHKKSPLTEFRLTFIHPDTQQTVVWQGARHFTPLLVDVVNKVPYLVVFGRPTRVTQTQYGCPVLPYVYLRYGEEGWHNVPVEQAPAALKHANLATHGMDGDAAGQHLSATAVAIKLDLQVQESRGLVQKTIPRTLADWHSEHKRGAMADRVVDDCRPQRASLEAMALPNALESHTSLLETAEYVPDKVLDSDAWNALVTDARRAAACKTAFRPVELEGHDLDLHFSQNPAKRKRVPFVRNGLLEPGVLALCDDKVWFVQNQPDTSLITITQYTLAGELVFRTAFARPAAEPELTGNLALPSLRAEGGYLYFDWLYTRIRPGKVLLKRALSLRVPAPALIR